MIHVLMISLDTSLATQPDGDSRRRHLIYAQKAGHLTVIVYAPRSVGGSVIQASPELTIVPSNSLHKLVFPLDAVRAAERTLGDQPIDLITTQEPFLTGLIGLWLRRRWRVPLLVQNHSYFFDNAAWLAEHPLRNRILHAVGRFVIARADMYRTVNRKECAHYLAAGGSPERVVALPLGTVSRQFAEPIDADVLASLRDRLSLHPSHKIVLWVGYPVGFKRVPLLFEVFKSVLANEPNARLVLIGDMSKSPQDLAALAQRMHIADSVSFYGPVPHSDLPPYYALGDVYVHTSAYEGVPRVLFEASAAGLPLVGMDVVGVDEVIEDGVNGYLVADGDTKAMAAQIVALLSDPARAREMGAAARRIAFDRYDADHYADAWVDVWKRAVGLGMRTAT